MFLSSNLSQSILDFWNQKDFSWMRLSLVLLIAQIEAVKENEIVESKNHFEWQGFSSPKFLLSY